ncbi:MAG: YbaK/EbsC family protein [Candidatus Rhabdochlamydia sp.]
MSAIFENLFQFITNSQIPFKHVQHQPTFTCEESAKARDEPLEIGAKSMLMKLDDTYALFVLSASKKLDSKKIKALIHCRSIRFATPEELFELTSLVPGSVPPFGKPILPFDLYIDLSIKDLPKIAFNAGSLSDSIVIATEDYLRLCNGSFCSFSK